MGYQVTPVKGLASLRNTKQDHYKKHSVKETFSSNRIVAGARHPARLLVHSLGLRGPGRPTAK